MQIIFWTFGIIYNIIFLIRLYFFLNWTHKNNVKTFEMFSCKITFFNIFIYFFLSDCYQFLQSIKK